MRRNLYWRNGAWRSSLCFGGELTFEPYISAYPLSVLPTHWRVFWRPFGRWAVQLPTRKGKVRGWYW